MFQAVFCLLLGPFVFFNVQKTKYLQIVTTAARWLGQSVGLFSCLLKLKTWWSWYTMGLGHNEAGPQWGWGTIQLGHNGAGVQWGWGTVGLGHNGTRAQRGWYTMGHSGIGTQWDWGTMVLGHNGTGTHRDGDPNSM